MSSEVETSRSEALRPFNGIPRLRSASLEMTNALFAALDVYYDDLPRTAAINMAVDEALLESATISTIRFYRWDHPALSFGYFGRYADVAQHRHDLVRRWTGGGIVFHGEDLTYSIVISASDGAFGESSVSIYEKVHRALCDALNTSGEHAVLAMEKTLNAQQMPLQLGATLNAQMSHACFVNPVHADVLLEGRKIAGAAQRRTRRGLLQQGSIQNVDVANGLAERFARALSNTIDKRTIDSAIIQRAQEIAERKYGTDAWLRKR